MDLKSAVNLAKEGKKEGWEYLYTETYEHMLYLAMTMLHDKPAAEDIVQQAYFNAMERITALENPEKFRSWMTAIVRNLTKDYWKKNNRMITFSALSDDDEGNSMEYNIEDDHDDFRPGREMEYDEIIAAMNSLTADLPDAQRQALIMFHYEKMSYQEIAEYFECSINTIRSRISQGRDKLRNNMKAAGYSLTGAAVIPFLLYLLDAERNSAKFRNMAAASMQTSKFATEFLSVGAGISGGAGTAVKAASPYASSGTSAASGSVFGIIGGKIAIAAVTAVIVGGAAIGIIASRNSEPQPESVPAAAVSQSSQDTETENTSSVEIQPDTEADNSSDSVTDAKTENEENEWKELSSDEYSSMISGNLTREQIALVLSFYPSEQFLNVTPNLPEQTLDPTDPNSLFLMGCTDRIASDPDKYGLSFFGYDFGSNGGAKYSVDEINRLYASFSDFRLTDSVLQSTPNHIDGDIFYLNNGVTMTYATKVNITNAEYNGSEMHIDYTYEIDLYHNGNPEQISDSYISENRATLEKGSDGLYKITDVSSSGGENKKSSDSSSSSESGGTTIEDEYKTILSSLGSGYRYFVRDLDEDSISELIVERVDGYYYYCDVYTCVKADSGYNSKKIEGGFEYGTMGVGANGSALALPSDGNGLYICYTAGMSGEQQVDRITIENGTLATEYAVYTSSMRTGQSTGSYDAEGEPEWHDVSDTSFLSSN